jgi:hypothetical protein
VVGVNHHPGVARVTVAVTVPSRVARAGECVDAGHVVTRVMVGVRELAGRALSRGSIYIVKI